MMFQNGLMLFQAHMKSAGWYQAVREARLKDLLEPNEARRNVNSSGSLRECVGSEWSYQGMLLANSVGS